MRNEEWRSRYKWAFRNTLAGYVGATVIIFMMTTMPCKFDVSWSFVMLVRGLQGLTVGVLVLHGYLASIAYYSMKESLKNEDHEDV